ncbi:MAG: hypothetical protein QM751_05700 [Paludibacteraceae bacterium]
MNSNNKKKIKKLANKNNIANKTSNVPLIESFDIRLAKIIDSNKKISERIVGYFPLDLEICIGKYIGKSSKPAQITPLEKAVVGILLIDENSTFLEIGNILGLDTQHDNAEKKLLHDAIENMRNFGAIEGDESYLCLTPKGKIFAEKGERPDTYSGTFEIFIIEKRPDFPHLKNCLKIDKIEKSDKTDDIQLSIEEIKHIAESQATNMHFPKSRYILESAIWEDGYKAKYKIYVCFIQSIRDNSVRTIVYDDYAQKTIEELSTLIELDIQWKNELFEKCLKIESENNDVEVLLENIEKSVEQETAENELILQEDELNSENQIQKVNSEIVTTSYQSLSAKAKLRKKALYDSIAFEAEIHNIFKVDEPDEIWLLSPWIKNHAFISSRGPLIERFLQTGGKIFISYSHPEKDDSIMVDQEAARRIELLDKQYPNFFYAELPNFHTKNVIEIKGEQCILFTGSFNVLSFYISENQTQVRREEMALAHHQVALKKYSEFLREFSDVYVNRAKKELSSLSDNEILSYNNDRLNYFRRFDFLKEIILPFDDLFDEKRLEAEINTLRIQINNLQSEIDNYIKAGSSHFSKKKNIENEIILIEAKANNVIIDSVTLSQIEQLKDQIGKLSVKNVFDGNKFKAEKPSNNRNPNEKLLSFALTYLTDQNLINENEIMKALVSLFYLSTLQAKIDNIDTGKLNNSILKLLSNDLLLSTCEIGLTKNKYNEGSSDVFIVFRKKLFVFRELSLGKLFYKIKDKKVHVDIKQYPNLRDEIHSLLESLIK